MKNKLILLSVLFSLYACQSIKTTASKPEESSNLNIDRHTTAEITKIPVLNLGTFHMGETSDVHKTEFDENDKKNQSSIKNIAVKLAQFKPTVIIVETPPSFDDKLQTEYNAYLTNPKMTFKNPSEIELLAYEVGRLSGAKQIYGIDHKMEYNFFIGKEISNAIDASWHDNFYKDPFKFYPEINVDDSKLNLLDKLRLTNSNTYLNFLIEANAEMLSHVGTQNGFEGADEATKYYQRNMRMYSNLNRLQLTPNDRVFILLGASHSAYFRDFISRSPKYQMVNTFDYLK